MLKIPFRKHALAMILIAVIGVLVYGSSLRNSFVYNDYQMVSGNDFLDSWGNLRYFLDGKYFAGSRENTYRPLVTLTFMADRSVWGEDPFGYHLTNLVFHVLNGILLYLMLCLLVPASNNGPPSGVPLLAALFFLVHPAGSEGVLSVGSRHDMVMTFFYFASVFFYLRAKTASGGAGKGSYLLSLLAYFLAMSAKEMGITLPAVIVLTETLRSWKEGRKNTWSGVFSPESIRGYAGYAIVAVCYLSMRFLLVTHPAAMPLSDNYLPQFLFGNTYATHLLTIIRVMCFTYLRLLFFPLRLSLEYPARPSFSPAEPAVIFSAGILIALVWLIVRYRRRYPLIFFGWAWFFLTLLPVTGIFLPMASTPVSERFLYLPAAGFQMFLATVILIPAGWRSRGRARKAAYALAAVVLCLYSLRTAVRCTDWKDSRTFWERAINTEYASYRSHNNLAMEYYYAGETGKAVRELETSIRIRDNAQARVNLGFIYLERGELEKAEKAFVSAIRLNPGYASAYYHLAAVRIEEEKYTEAEELLDTALEKYAASGYSRPFHAEAYNAMGMIKSMKGDPDAAVENYRAALKLNPGYVEARYGLARIYTGQRYLQEAEREYLIVLERSPSHVDARNNLANIYYMRGMVDKAAEEFAKVLETDPGHVNARNNLANIYLRKGMYDEAIEQYKRVLASAPDKAVVHFNLGIAYKRKNMLREAEQEWTETLRIDPGFKRAGRALETLRGGEAAPGGAAGPEVKR